MKKYLVLASLLFAFTQPVMAQGMYYQAAPSNSCGCPQQVIQVPICPQARTCAPVYAPRCPVSVQCNGCSSCSNMNQGLYYTGAAAPIYGTAAPACCPAKKGFWSNFFSF